MKCNQCDSLYINGVFCHETGCINQNKKFINNEWVFVYKCRECGCELLEDEICTCYEPIEDDEL